MPRSKKFPNLRIRKRYFCKSRASQRTDTGSWVRSENAITTIENDLQRRFFAFAWGELWRARTQTVTIENHAEVRCGLFPSCCGIVRPIAVGQSIRRLLLEAKDLNSKTRTVCGTSECNDDESAVNPDVLVLTTASIDRARGMSALRELRNCHFHHPFWY